MELDRDALFSRLGAIEHAGKERAEQNSEIFEILRQIQGEMAKKSDIAGVHAVLHGDPSFHGKDRRGLVGRIEQLEIDKANVKHAVIAAIGLPPFIAAVIECGKFMLGRH